MSEPTPMMRQYRALKDKHPRAILLFRLGDFFEAFFEDAHVVARELGLTLTSRPVAKGRRIPMCGIPHHALQTYLRRLIDRGHRVAICDQVEDPRHARTLVRREVVRIVTPGTVVEDDLLTPRENNFLAALAPSGDAWGLALADLSTGEFFATEGRPPLRPAEALARWRPRELLVPEGAGEELQVTEDLTATAYDAWRFDPALGDRALREHLEVATLDAFGLRDAPLATAAAGVLVQYLRETQKGPLPHLRNVRLLSPQDGLVLDETARRALGLWRTSRDSGPADTLLDTIDLTETAMGGRLLRRWLAQPLLDLDAIAARQDAVEAFAGDAGARETLRARLHVLGDLERLCGRLGHDAGTPRDLAALRGTLEALPGVLRCVEHVGAAGVRSLLPALAPPPDLPDLLCRALADAVPLSAKDGGLIRDGFDGALDGLREGSRAAREWMAGLEAAERVRTGIRSLKVGYNQVAGYYVEVTRANAHLVPPDYVRKGTLVSAERYVTAAMKDKEALILSAQEQINAREYEVFCDVRAEVRGRTPALQAAARALAECDVYAALAEAAVRRAYVRPRLGAGRTISITEGRHPVVEHALGPERFVPNDLRLGADRACGAADAPPARGAGDDRGAAPDVLVVTGPNFGGKSTYIRQAALIVILAQMGAFVPARDAEIGMVDRIFTRVGAADDLAAGRSTFLSEMIEVARILTQATDRSLVILDEVGRGTSTYDGMSLAWAVVEDLHDRVGARTLFATHYHELTDLAGQLPRVANAQVLVREEGQRVVFLHRVAPGAAGSSYGIQVARLAGVPDPVVRRAREVLAGLERSGSTPQPARARRGPRRAQQLALALPSPIEQAVRDADLAAMTPLDALNFLARLRGMLDAAPGDSAPEAAGGPDAPAAGPGDTPRRAADRTVVPFPRTPRPPR